MFAGADKPISLFQSTLLQEERRNWGLIQKVRLIFQSTLLQEERPLHLQNPVISDSISIHAPTRGATEVSVSSIIKQSISIHAPTRGATSTFVFVRLS